MFVFYARANVWFGSCELLREVNCVQKLKEAERKRMNELEEFDKKANVQLERQLVMASSWSRALLTLRGKLKGTEWDPENSHRIDYSDFLRLLDSNNVQFMEYSNYGQTISGCDFSFLFFFSRIRKRIHLLNEKRLSP